MIVTVKPFGDKWSVQVLGRKRRARILDTQTAAIQEGKRIAINNKCELWVYRQDRTVR
jgi:hypothetical protein